MYVRKIRNPNTMAQEGCMVFTFEGKAVFEKIRRNSEYTGLFVNFQGQQPVFEENLQADTKMCIRDRGSQAEFIILTNLEEFSLAQKALRLGALDYLVKSEITPEVLGESLQKAVEVCREKQEQEAVSYTHLLFY